MERETIGAAIIGCGAIARKKHIPTLLNHPNIQLLMLCSRSLEPARQCRQQFGCWSAELTQDPEKVFCHPDVDLVVIASPTGTHEEYAVRAMDAGKHVLCEKPMASSAAGARRMLEASRRNNRLLHISYQNRYTDQALCAKELTEAGALSDIYYAKAYAIRRRALPTWVESAAPGNGPLLDIGSHAIDLALWLSGSFEPEYALGTVYRQLAERGSRANLWGPWDTARYKAEDLAVGLVQMKNGLTLSVEASYALNCSEEKESSVDLFGTGGGLELRQQDGLTLIQEQGGRMFIARDRMQMTPRNLTPESACASPSRRELDSIVELLLDGRTDDPSAQQAVVVSEIVEALYRSAETKEAIRWGGL